ncbi:hypothetical protein [Butyrivibrio sp. INlla16]|uniref:hypothetical protein n=1 Tax=Butyrivibrio sp. INlla16 TaxID=1520807 RepID=UPI00088CA5CB|nr:hypothetical protein [Butyrivibrio sp. INlla16]SDB58376.1 hypothetical protein SAMN02910263_03008 [Butyrivibrio sp. INlla16]
MGSNSNDPPSEASYSTSIPTAVEVGTYLVWYKCVGNEEYNDTAPEYVSAEIKAAPAEGKTTPQEEEKTAPPEEEKPVITEKQNNKLPKISKPKLSATSKSVTVKWSKLSKKDLKKADKIEIWICTNKSFSEKDTIKKTVKKSKDCLTVKGLKSKKTYYVKMRTIKNVSGVKNVGSWTKVKKIKTDKS